MTLVALLENKSSRSFDGSLDANGTEDTNSGGGAVAPLAAHEGIGVRFAASLVGELSTEGRRVERGRRRGGRCDGWRDGGRGRGDRDRSCRQGPSLFLVYEQTVSED